MKVGVAGLWHLGVTYAVGFAELGHDVVAYDPNSDAILGFERGELLVFEPQLQDMLLANTKLGNLKFTNRERDLSDVDLLVLAYDTPLDDDDNADVNFVISEFVRIARNLDSQTHILVCSQLPVGSSDSIEDILQRSSHKGDVVVQPENLRLGKAVDSFFKSERIIVGTKDGKPNRFVIDLFSGIDIPIVWMHRRSAEVTKHALNTFLATSVTFMGEVSEICENVGADAKEVEIGLRSDPRIGTRAYLSPGLGFAGGTLARDVQALSKLQSELRETPTIFRSLLESNRHNNDWVSRSIASIPIQKDELRICFWGVSYTENTDTLRRSEIYTLMKNLANENAEISFVENLVIKDLKDTRIFCVENIEESLKNINVLIVNKKLEMLVKSTNVIEKIEKQNVWILDPSRILLEFSMSFANNPQYLTVGKGI
jgi:UDPglucose 6-dehydrogenase